MDAGRITDPLAQSVIAALEGQLAQALEALGAAREEIRRLRDEISRLKGEQGRPAVRPSKAAWTHSSEADRPEANTGAPRGRPERPPPSVTREETCRVAREALPADARFRGYKELVVQDLELRAEVVRFRREKAARGYPAPGTGRAYLAPLPPGYAGHFWPGSRRWHWRSPT